MSKAMTMDSSAPRYGAVELVLILVALALVVATAWYIRHATVATNTTYSITETSQKASTPNRAVLDKNAGKTTTPQQ